MRRLAAGLGCLVLAACGGNGPAALTPEAASPQAAPNGAPIFRWIPKHEVLTYGAGADTVKFEYSDGLAKPQLHDNCADYAPKKPRVTIKLKKTIEKVDDRYAEYKLSAKYGAGGLSPYACTIVMTDASDKHLKATLKVRVTYPALSPSLYVSDYTGGKILKYALPVVANELPTSAFPVAPSGAQPVALSIASNGTVFYAANDAAFDTIYVGSCTSSGSCTSLRSISGVGSYVAATGIAINAAATSGYLVYSSGTAMATAGYIEPFSVSGSTLSLASTPLASISQAGTPVFPTFPIGSPYAGAALDGNGDLAVAMPYGLTEFSVPTGIAVFPGGSSTPTYYHYGGPYETIAAAWVYGSNTTFYGLVIPTNYMYEPSWFVCTAGTSGCAPPIGSSQPANMMNTVGIALDASSGVYVSTLGTLGSPNPFPPHYGTQFIYTWDTATNEVIQNSAGGEPYQTPWGVAVGP
jgi:hypothetical protein